VRRAWVLLAAPAPAVVLASSVVLHGTVLVAIVVGTGLVACLAYALPDGGPAASVEAAWKAAAGFFALSVGTAGLGVVAGGRAAAVFVLLVIVAVGVAWLRWYLRTRAFDRDEFSTVPDDDETSQSTSSVPRRFSCPCRCCRPPPWAESGGRRGPR
jgi:hypothetical protein